MKFSEYDEEQFLMGFFKNTPAGFFVDIGANNGWKGSNTRALFLKGWGGVLVEANPRTFRNLQKTYANQARVSLVQSAVWDRSSPVAFYAEDHEDSGLSATNAHYEGAKGYDKIIVPCMTLDGLFERLGMTGRAVDLLTLDTEGCDFDILKSYSFREQPAMIMPEFCMSGDDNALNRFDALLGEHGYNRIWANVANAAYVKR